MQQPFTAKLRNAYQTDYDRNVYALGRHPVHWWKKFAFNNEVTEQRVLFRCGDFIWTKYNRYRNDSIARINHIFTHEVVAGSRRLFLDVTPIIPSQPPRNDELLAVPVLKIACESDIVALPAVDGTRLYVLPFIEQDGNGMELSMGKMSIDSESEDKVLCVNWNIQFL
ncbi:MAG: hypothetical protein FRX48_02049 [Lasallia pustulata]|uniref:Uncharacterized protein n=1 Tax=Lasallia pustulata TaxID=136370 RepID=A0A5M8PY85_9LECA|nr:MAG: hypothetical protein FRX48_02049 [Lasallia pustulata]